MAKKGSPIIQLRILSYNIHAGVGTDEVIDLDRIAAVIRRADPDLVALQEVDRFTERSGTVDQAAVLSELLGFDYCFAKALDLEGGEYGDVALSRLPILRKETNILPGGDGSETRAAAELTVAVGNPMVRLKFISTHLDHESEEERIAQVRTLREIYLDDDPSPMILAGDFNATPGDATLRELAVANWVNTEEGDGVPTFPSPNPTMKIDYVLARPANRFRAVDGAVIDEKVASDHRPIITTIDLIE